MFSFQIPLIVKHLYSRCFCDPVIDPMQKWLLLNYLFVRIQNNLANLVRDDKWAISISVKEAIT